MAMPQSIKKVEQAVEEMVEDLQRSYLIPRQKEAFLCCARCCDSASSSGDVRQLEQCVQTCSTGPSTAQRAIQQQLQEFQERFQRAAMRCQDVAKDSVPYDASPTDQQRAQEEFNRCMESSGQDILQRVPKLKADLVSVLKRM